MRDMTPAAELPIVPPGGIALPPRATSGVLPYPPRRADALPSDVVEFDAECPGCGAIATWHERREDTHTVIAVDCRICDRRDRMRLAASA